MHTCVQTVYWQCLKLAPKPSKWVGPGTDSCCQLCMYAAGLTNRMHKARAVRFFIYQGFVVYSDIVSSIRQRLQSTRRIAIAQDAIPRPLHDGRHRANAHSASVSGRHSRLRVQRDSYEGTPWKWREGVDQPRRPNSSRAVDDALRHSAGRRSHRRTGWDALLPAPAQYSDPPTPVSEASLRPDTTAC